MRKLVGLWLVVCSAACAQLTPVPPPPTATPSHPFFITKSWVIGGVGNWDYLTMDPVARQLFIAHGPAVQVVNVDAGNVAGTVHGLRDAHAICLDEQGNFGYISDGGAQMVRVFDRRTFQVVASIPTAPAPRSMVLDPVSGLLFVVGSQVTADGAKVPRAETPQLPLQRMPHRSGAATAPPRAESTITVIDPERRLELGQILLPGALGFAQGDGDGRVYITVADRNQIMRLDAQAIGAAVNRAIDAEAKAKTANPHRRSPQNANEKPLVLDWTSDAKERPPADAYPSAFSLGSTCQEPRALAFDPRHARLFAACSNFRMVVLNAATGQSVATLPIGPAPDAIGYDANRGLIFTANGGGDGSVTIIRQDVTDTYSVIQTLPTRQHARTLAVDPSNGNVYLTSVLYGAPMNTPFTNGRPANLKVSPVDSSFQVLVVGN